MAITTSRVFVTITVLLTISSMVKSKPILNSNDVSKPLQTQEIQQILEKARSRRAPEHMPEKLNNLPSDELESSLQQVLDRIKRDYTGLTIDMTYLKLLLLKISEMQKNHLVKQVKSRRINNPSNDIIDEEDDAEINRGMRNYYGWMDFGK